MTHQKSIIFVEKAFPSFSKLLILHSGSPLRGGVVYEERREREPSVMMKGFNLWNHDLYNIICTVGENIIGAPKGKIIFGA